MLWLAAVSMRAQMECVKPAIAPAWHATASRASVCHAPMDISWRVARVASTAPCGRTLRMTARAAAASHTVTSAQMTGTVSVGYQLSAQLSFQIRRMESKMLQGLPFVWLFQNAVSSIWCCTGSAGPVAPAVITRIWRKAAVASATQPVAPVQGRWRMTARAAHRSTPNCTKGCAPKTAHPGPTMIVKL